MVKMQQYCIFYLKIKEEKKSSKKQMTKFGFIVSSLGAAIGLGVI